MSKNEKFWFVRQRYREPITELIIVYETDYFKIQVCEDVSKEKDIPWYTITAKYPSIFDDMYVRGHGTCPSIVTKGIVDLGELIDDATRVKELEAVLPDIDKDAFQRANEFRAGLNLSANN